MTNHTPLDPIGDDETHDDDDPPVEPSHPMFDAPDDVPDDDDDHDDS